MTTTIESIPADQLVSLTEASRVASTTPETIRRWIDTRLLRGVWLGGRRYAVRADLQRLLRDRGVRPIARRAAETVGGR